MKVKNTLLLSLLLTLVVAALTGQTPTTLEVRLPEAERVVMPVIPYEYQSRAVSGEVTVKFRLDPQGRVRDLQVEDATHPEYAQSVVNALREWKFAVPADKEAAGDRFYRLPVRFFPTES